jgi:hypothetical protein
MAKISVLGVDLGKNVCSVVGLDAPGAVVMRRRMRRETLIGLAEKLPGCVVGMEGVLRLTLPRPYLHQPRPRLLNMSDPTSRRRRTTIATPRGSPR